MLHLSNFQWNKVHAALILLLLPTSLHAYPSAAGHCNQGSLTNKSFGIHGNTGSGPLSEGSLKVTIGDTILDPDTILNIEPGEEYKVILEGPTRGFLFRLEALDNRNVYEVFSSSNSDVQRKRGSLCSTSVAAMTHTNREVKDTIEFDLSFPASTQTPLELRLDVTVVASRSSYGSNDWYYDLYNLSVLSTPETNSPTVSPTAFPSDSPTDPPTSSSTTSPTKSPTTSPTVSPSKLPSAPPTVSPTTSPSDYPSALPADTDSITAPPSNGSSSPAPSVFPTQVPTSSAPTITCTDNPGIVLMILMISTVLLF
mmetsp:Transcript_6610/g.7185  ORF Transcript_6610/g.7185 Transcript_6610/m.7185 type:complete len:312 (-) Transcript_6610:245-1180(-)